jgi:SPP1 family predicted phage head-tail adaptor
MTMASRRTERITIRRKVSARDATTGAETVTWQDRAPIWAEVRPLRGRELVQMAQQESETEIVFNVYYEEAKDVTADARIVWRNQVYELTEPPIDVGARRREIELMCRSANG